MSTKTQNITFLSLSVFILSFPFTLLTVFASAHHITEPSGPLAPIVGSIKTISESITGLTGVVFTLSIIFFFWKVGLFIFASDATSRSDARKGMLNGLIAVFVIASIWGIVALLQGATGIEQKDNIDLPGIIITP